MFEVGLCLSGDVGEGLVRRTVAGRAECSRSDFVCPGSTDVIGDAALFGGIFVSTSRKRGGKLRQFYQVQTI